MRGIMQKVKPYLNLKSLQLLYHIMIQSHFQHCTSFCSFNVGQRSSPVALQLRPPPPKVSARAPAHRSYHFRGVKLKSCIKKIHHNLYISKQANVRIKHADTEGASHKKFGTDARVQLDIYADTAKRKQ